MSVLCPSWPYIRADGEQRVLKKSLSRPRRSIGLPPHTVAFALSYHVVPSDLNLACAYTCTLLPPHPHLTLFLFTLHPDHPDSTDMGR
jgi:hypothetical protein